MNEFYLAVVNYLVDVKEVLFYLGNGNTLGSERD